MSCVLCDATLSVAQGTVWISRPEVTFKLIFLEDKFVFNKTGPAILHEIQRRIWGIFRN